MLGFGECELVLSAASVFLGFCAWRRGDYHAFHESSPQTWPFTHDGLSWPCICNVVRGGASSQFLLFFPVQPSLAGWHGAPLELCFQLGSDSWLPYLLPCRDLPGFMSSLQGLFLKGLERAVLCLCCFHSQDFFTLFSTSDSS